MATAVESIKNLKSAVAFLLRSRRFSVVSFSFFLTDYVSHVRLLLLSMGGEGYLQKANLGLGRLNETLRTLIALQ